MSVLPGMRRSWALCRSKPGPVDALSLLQRARVQARPHEDRPSRCARRVRPPGDRSGEHGCADGWVEHLDAIGFPHTAINENPYRPGEFSIDVIDPDGHEIELIFEP